MNSKERRRPRVCLIVDNPLRDLDGLVLLGLHLAMKNVNVYLVSMSNTYEVFFIKPDMVLLNYIRKANSKFIKKCEYLGIKIGVLDTEGGILKDVEFFFGSIFRYVNKIDLYCLWGLKQYEALVNFNILDRASLMITGCPRYDFCVPPWSNALPDVPVSYKEIVLVNTNFPVIQPRFQTPEIEAKELITDVGFKKEYVSELLHQSRYARDELVASVKYIARRFSNLFFIVRPHPFEDKSFYESSFNEFSNIEVHQSGSVFSWIRRAIAVIHHNCSTAIEAVMMGKEPIHLAWIDTPLLAQPASIGVSQQAYSLSQLEDMLSNLSAHRQLDVSAEKKGLREQTIKTWFYSTDGANSERVADAIIETINKPGTEKRKYRKAKLLFIDTIIQKDFKCFIKHLFIIIFGSVIYRQLKRHKHKEGKNFDVKGVQDILTRTSKAVASTEIVSAHTGTKKQMRGSIWLTRDSSNTQQKANG